LNWSKSEATDTDHYNVYMSEQQFDNVTKAKNIINITSEEQTIQTIINVTADDKEYHFAVTAVDTSKNELQIVDSKIGVSVDDLGPIAPTIIPDNKDNPKELKIILPTLNEDGSTIPADEELSLFLRLPGDKKCLDLVLIKDINTILGISDDFVVSGKPGEEKSYPILIGKESCYAFTVKDSKGNIKDLMKYSDEDKKNLIAIFPTRSW
jgi:hypothetical protein